MSLWRSVTQRSQGTVVGIDAGNVDVRAAIATLDRDLLTSERDLTVPVLGMGFATAQGLRRGIVTDPSRLGAAMRAAVSQAEKAAGHRVLGAYFSVPLAQFQPETRQHRRGAFVLSSPRAVQEITLNAIDHAPVWESVATAAGLTVVEIVPSVLAASAAVVLPAEYAQGVVVIECGAEHTSVAVFANETIVCIGTIPVGGDHITRDLAHVLAINPMEAERLKFEIGNARGSNAGVEVLVQGPDGTRSAVSVALVAAIITARVEQILGRVNEMIRPVALSGLIGDSSTAIGEVVLCGGGAALSGLAQMTRTALGMPVRVAGAWGFIGSSKVQSPAYASVLGLLRWRVSVQPRLEAPQRRSQGIAVRRSSGETRPNSVGQPMRVGQTRWQQWLREFLP